MFALDEANDGLRKVLSQQSKMNEEMKDLNDGNDNDVANLSIFEEAAIVSEETNMKQSSSLLESASNLSLPKMEQQMKYRKSQPFDARGDKVIRYFEKNENLPPNNSNASQGNYVQSQLKQRQEEEQEVAAVDRLQNIQESNQNQNQKEKENNKEDVQEVEAEKQNKKNGKNKNKN